MSFYRHIIISAAVVCFSTSVMAATAVQNTPANTPPIVQTSDAAKASTTHQGRININTASLQELMNVKGMNRLKAKCIVRYRNQHPFKSLDELGSVRGFKKMDKENLTAFQQEFTVN